MSIEIEQLKLRLIESQMQNLQYQHRDVLENIKQIENRQQQAKFDSAVDARNMPSGATRQPDPYAGD